MMLMFKVTKVSFFLFLKKMKTCHFINKHSYIQYIHYALVFIEKKKE
jgi:hypothetical protein